MEKNEIVFKRKVEHYNLDSILSVLKEYIIRGYALTKKITDI